MQYVRDFLYWVVAFFARVHDSILEYNRCVPKPFTDVELHFIVIGFFGLILLILLYPIFRFLVRRFCVGLITWLFAFILIVFTCFAIEFGQYMTNTGKMQLIDVASGIMGFFAATGIVLALVLCVKGVIALIALIRKK